MIFLCRQGIHALVPAMQKTYSGIFLGKARPRTQGVHEAHVPEARWSGRRLVVVSVARKRSGAAAPWLAGPLALQHHLPSALLLYKSISQLNLQRGFSCLWLFAWAQYCYRYMPFALLQGHSEGCTASESNGDALHAWTCGRLSREHSGRPFSPCSAWPHCGAAPGGTLLQVWQAA